MIEFFVRRRIATAMLFLGICLLGAISRGRLRGQRLPDIEFPRLTVVTPYENAAPSEIEQLVTRYIEEAVSSVAGVRSVYSESIEGMSLVSARFGWGSEMDLALIETKEKVDIVKGQLPQDAGKSIVVRFDPREEPVMIYSISAGTGDFRELRRRIEREILPSLERVEGVALADLNGGYRRQLNVDLDGAKIYAHKLSISEVMENVSAANYSYPAGTIEKGGREYLVRTVGEYQNLAEIGGVVVGRNESGLPSYLRAIAEVSDGYKDRKSIIRLNGNESIGVLVQKEPGKNTIETCRRVDEKMRRLGEKHKKDFVIRKVFDQSLFVRNAVDNVFIEAVMGAVISFLIILFFLKDIRSSLIIATSIPVSVLGAFSLMYFRGITLNTMSLGGLALGAGMMVDAGTVVLDSIAARKALLPGKRTYSDLIRAVIQGANEVKAPVCASVLTSVVVFLPILFLSGLTGAVFGELALTISFSLLCSLACALALMPMLAALPAPALGPAMNARGRAARWRRAFCGSSDRATARCIALYRRTIEYALRSPGRVLWAGAFVSVAGVLLFLCIDTEIMPKVDPGEFSIDIAAERGTTLEESSALCAGIERVLLRKPYVQYVYTKIGSDPEDSVMEKMSGRGANNSLIRVILKKNRRMHVRRIIASLQRELRFSDLVRTEYRIREDVIESVFKAGGRALAVELFGRDVDELKALGERMRERIARIPGVQNAESVLDGGNPELRLMVDRNAMASLGVDMGNIASSVRAAIQGEAVTKFRERDDEIDVRVRLSGKHREGRDSLYKILVKADSGAPIPLLNFITVDEGRGAGKIIRSEQSRVNIISADISGDRGRVLRRVREAIAEMRFPPGYEAKLAGESDELSRVSGEMLFAVALSILLVYMVLASQFQSLRSPLILMLSIPVTAIGVSGALLLAGKTININSCIGIVLLAGTVVNNAIVLFDFIENERKKGKDIASALIDAGTKRLKPILITSGNTVLGMLPIAVGIGEGTELQQPLAVAVIGGLSVSTLLTLVFIPTAYYMLNKKREPAR